mgnify:CR=1 FL=1
MLRAPCGYMDTVIPTHLSRVVRYGACRVTTKKPKQSNVPFVKHYLVVIISTAYYTYVGIQRPVGYLQAPYTRMHVTRICIIVNTIYHVAGCGLALHKKC